MDELDGVVAFLDRSYLFPATGGHMLGSGRRSGIVWGEPGQPIRRVLLAATADEHATTEAITAGADLLITCSAPAEPVLTGPGAQILPRLIRAGISLYSIESGAASRTGGHEGADDPLSHSLAAALDLTSAGPLVPARIGEYAVLVVYIPPEDAEALRRALADAGAGAIGDYTGCAWSVAGTGEFTPETGADPTIGRVGSHERVAEQRLEMVVPLPLIDQVTAALRASHPYEEPAFSFLAVHPPRGRFGRGRIGELDTPATAGDLARTLAGQLPEVALRVAGADRPVTTVAISPGAAVAEAAGAGADALISTDLTHADLEAARGLGISLIDVPRLHFAWPWLPHAARALAAATGGEIDTIVSTSLRTWDRSW